MKRNVESPSALKLSMYLERLRDKRDAEIERLKQENRRLRWIIETEWPKTIAASA